MGIPGFFGWLLKQYGRNRFVSKTINRQIRELYIDANCMIHPSCFKILNRVDGHIPFDELENAMITQCIDDLDYIIKYVSPKDKLYIAVDGVAPLAKIYQQRKRRYKSCEETQLKNEIKRKYNIKMTNEWTNASITPGTIFMEKLHSRIYEYLKTLKYPNKIIYSSYHTPGEGEHKIFDHIRETLVEHDITRIVYGLDADLIFLSMACIEKNIFLIRESSDISHNSDTSTMFEYVNINNVINCFNDHVYSKISELMYKYGINKEIKSDVTNDIIFICYLLGNDFLPHVPSIDIKKGGLEMLLDAYVEVYIKYMTPLISDNYEIDMLFFDEFLSILSEYEKEWFENFDEFAYENNIKKSNERFFENAYEREIWNIDNMKHVKHYDVFKKDIGTFDDWKFRYYEYYFGCSESQEQTIKNVCQNYLDGIYWITQYYFGKCKSWNWVFNYSHAPFICDLSKFIKTRHYNMNNSNISIGNPLDASVQLLCVIPPQYYILLDPSYIPLMISDKSPIGYMFPSSFLIDTHNEMYWQCSPFLPNIDINKIKKCIEGIKKSERMEIVDKVTDDIKIK